MILYKRTCHICHFDGVWWKYAQPMNMNGGGGGGGNKKDRQIITNMNGGGAIKKIDRSLQTIHFKKWLFVLIKSDQTRKTGQKMNELSPPAGHVVQSNINHHLTDRLINLLSFGMGCEHWHCFTVIIHLSLFVFLLPWSFSEKLNSMYRCLSIWSLPLLQWQQLLCWLEFSKFMLNQMIHVMQHHVPMSILRFTAVKDLWRSSHDNDCVWFVS